MLFGPFKGAEMVLRTLQGGKIKKGNVRKKLDSAEMVLRTLQGGKIKKDKVRKKHDSVHGNLEDSCERCWCTVLS